MDLVLRHPTDSSNSGPLVTFGLWVYKLHQHIHSTTLCLATIGVSASSAQPSHRLCLVAISARASSMHPFDCLCHCLRHAIISARASSVHPSDYLRLATIEELRILLTASVIAFVLQPSPSSCNYQLSSLSRDTEPFDFSVPSSSSTANPRPPILSQWWVESSHELHDPTRKDSQVVLRMFTLASNLHSTMDHINPFPLLERQIRSRSKAVLRKFRYSEDGVAKHYDKPTLQLLAYLTSRHRSICIVKPYNPHRFGQQYSFNQHILGELNEDLRTITLEQVVCFWCRCLRLVTGSEFLIPACPSEHEALCMKDYMNWWARRSNGFISSGTEQLIGNVNPSKMKLKIRHPNEVVEPVKRRSDKKPSLGISEAINESLERACVDKAHSPKHGPSCIVSMPQDVEVTKGVTQAADYGVDMDSLPGPSGGSAQDDNYPSKRAGKKCTPVATSPSTSKFSIQGSTAFNSTTKEIDPSRLGKTNATLSSDPIT
nr:hypothetical protein CFP56_18215 [Quercus suber]